MREPMRRFRQQLSQEETLALLSSASHGTLALLGEDGYPYAVPLSFAVKDGRIYFHCATAGHKLSAVRHCPRASFCVVGQDVIVPEKFTTLYRSAIAFGTIREATDPQEILMAARLLARRYAPDAREEDIRKEIDGALKRVCILVMDIEQITGKEARELVQEKAN